jgi:5-methylcytosine-specific restriction endonuclease McrA
MNIFILCSFVNTIVVCKHMKLKLIILLLIASNLSFGQVSLQRDSISKSFKSYVSNTKRDRKKGKRIEQKQERTNDANNGNYYPFFLLILAAVLLIINRSIFEMKRKHRRDYYRDEYLKSDAWQRKRYVVLKRDNWRCVYCGANATQVHHKKYARNNIGKEPIEWLVSVCKSCHDSIHHISK